MVVVDASENFFLGILTLVLYVEVQGGESKRLSPRVPEPAVVVVIAARACTTVAPFAAKRTPASTSQSPAVREIEVRFAKTVEAPGTLVPDATTDETISPM